MSFGIKNTIVAGAIQTSSAIAKYFIRGHKLIPYQLRHGIMIIRKIIFHI